MKFKALHQQAHPLIIANVWDVSSAKAAEKSNFQAIGTSSSAIAQMLGYEDGEEMSFDELEYIVKRIISHTPLPLSVDLEAGYSRTASTVVYHIKRLVDLGVVGINIEDSVVDGSRNILAAAKFAQTLSLINNQLVQEKINIFLNVRTDTFLLGLPDLINETKKRIQLYENAGADGIFIPCIVKEDEIKSIVASTTLPINVMSMPQLPDFETLKTLGVQRISMGNFLYDNMYQHLEQTLQSITIEQSFKPVF